MVKVSASLFKVGVTFLHHEAVTGGKQRKGGSLSISPVPHLFVVPESPAYAAPALHTQKGFRKG